MSKPTQDWVNTVNSLKADDIAARIEELEAEIASLRPLLRSARSKEAAKRRKDQKKST